jgi:hypothetical protein
MERFQATVRRSDRGRVFVALPFAPAARWGPRALYLVRGTVDGHGFEGRLSTRQLVWFFTLSPAFLAEAGVVPGAEVTVEIEPGGR